MGWKFWEPKDEEEKTAIRLNRLLDSIDDRRNLKHFLFGVAVANTLLWLVVIIFPVFSGMAFKFLAEAQILRVTIIIFGIPFGLGFGIVYAILRLRIPDLESREFKSGFMSGFDYSERMRRRWAIWSIATIGGVLNVFGLFLVDIYMAHGF